MVISAAGDWPWSSYGAMGWYGQSAWLATDWLGVETVWEYSL